MNEYWCETNALQATCMKVQKSFIFHFFAVKIAKFTNGNNNHDKHFNYLVAENEEVKNKIKFIRMLRSACGASKRRGVQRMR